MDWKRVIFWEHVKYFKVEEFVCPCCHHFEIDDDLILKLDNARRLSNIPFIITSGYRCPSHNKLIGGSIDSSHLSGKAADISVDSKSRYFILRSLILSDFYRIGIGKDFIHVDVDIDKPSPCIWTY